MGPVNEALQEQAVTTWLTMVAGASETTLAKVGFSSIEVETGDEAGTTSPQHYMSTMSLLLDILEHV
jgi:hypothetical protein